MNDEIRAQLDEFFSHYPRVTFPKGKLLMLPGDRAEKIYYLVSGRVCQFDITYRGDEIIVNTYRPPSFFPASNAINNNPTQFFYKTEVVTIAHAAPAQDVLVFMHSNPEVTFNLLSRVYIGVESVLNRMIHLMSGTARSRLIFELIIEYKRFGETQDDSGYIDINEASIAARSGLSRETVSREMRLLKEKGLVAIHARKIRINSISKLEAQLGAHI